VRIAAGSGADRIVVLDSLTHCDARVTARDVVVAGSFAGALAFGFALERGVRGLVAHAAGVGRDAAGISGLPLADRFGIPAVAVDTASARLGDGWSVFSDGVVAHANVTAAALGVAATQPASAAAHAMLAAPPGTASPTPLVDRRPRVVAEVGGGRVVLLDSMSFAMPEHRADVLCAGSHGGRVNVERLLAVRPRGALFNDGGRARDASGVSGLAALDAVGVAAACVDAMSARIGDPASTYADGVVSAVNEAARRVGVAVGQPAAEAARRMLLGGP
jgi:hypothetical protein